jgi:DNA-directed RNA polymerase specialized sigma24 family protein
VNNDAPEPEPGSASPALELRHRDELERIAAGAAESARLLRDLGSTGLEEALAVISQARYELDRTERRLVRLARRAGLSWAQIGVQLGITTGTATRERFNGSP